MRNTKDLKEFRSEAIAKLALLKSSYKLSIEAFPAPLLDFFVSLADHPKVAFAVAVRPVDQFTRQLEQQRSKLELYRASGLINVPVLLMKIDNVRESGQFDFLVEPVPSGELRLKGAFEFKTLNTHNLDQLIEEIIRWKNSSLVRTPA
ncbi:MAG TPA: hypothetical protein VF646_19615 [Cytophagales bacterium]